MTDGIRLTYTGIDRQIRRITRVQQVIEDPAMDAVVRDIAKVWQVNFDTEGSKVGGWRELAEMTQEVRKQRGFDPQHPILKQYGVLRRAAIEALLRANGDTSAFGKGVSMRLTMGHASANLIISGKKVSNQFRRRVRGSGAFSRPPRRFWYVDDEVKAAAHRGLLNGVLEEVRKR